MTDKEQMSRGDALAKVAALEAELAQKSLLVREMDLMFGRMLLGMRAAVIEEEHGKGAENAMMWIFNGLVGPGELPPEEEKDAQIYFDREVKAIDDGMKQIMDERKALGAAPTPVERVEQEAVAMLLIDDATAAESGDWDIEPIPAAIEKLARSGGATLPLYTTPQPAAPAQHSDDVAVDRFAAAMKAKLAAARAKGRSGWDDPAACSVEYLAQLLREHLAKGNAGTFEDVANFCMMLHQRGADPAVLAPTAAQDVTGLVEALEWCEKWFSRHSPTAALISGEHATHPMLSSIRAALDAHQSGGAK